MGVAETEQAADTFINPPELASAGSLPNPNTELCMTSPLGAIASGGPSSCFTHPTMHIEGTLNPRMNRTRFIAVSLLTMAASLTALAQTTDTTTTTSDAPKKDDQVFVLDTYKVTGSFATSLAAAAEKKEASKALVEVIAPEDIGKLPDVSIADSLTRLTGLTSQRVNGRAQQINIRGFSPDFSTGTLDGVEQATTNDNRAVEFDQYPSELLGGVVVTKTGQANTIGGLAGNVDLQTTSPLSASHRIVALKTTYNWTSLGQITPGVKKDGNSYSVSYIDQFDGGKEGIYLGFAHSENPTSGNQYGSWGYSTVSNNSYNPQWGSVVAGSDANQILGGMKFYDYQELLKRDSYVAVFESKPTENIHSKVDVFYSQFDDNQLLNGLQMGILPDWADWRVAGGSSSTPQIQPGFTESGGVVKTFTLKNVLPVTQDLVTRWTTKMESVVWNLDLMEKSDWPIHLDAGYSKATRKEEVLEDYVTLGSFGTTATGNPGPTWVINNNGGPKLGSNDQRVAANASQSIMISAQASPERCNPKNSGVHSAFNSHCSKNNLRARRCFIHPPVRQTSHAATAMNT